MLYGKQLVTLFHKVSICVINRICTLLQIKMENLLEQIINMSDISK